MIIQLLCLLSAAFQNSSQAAVDLGKAVVFTINEGTGGSSHAMALMADIPADLMLRSWFKWREAPPVAQWKDQPELAHRRGAIFGGGITCSALYDGENGLTPAQIADMATRDPAGNFVNAWGQPGIRHGSLSSPAYVEYLFKWCREQIDAGTDSLFMDERDAAITDPEGYDDHSLIAFRDYLISQNRRTFSWSARDTRWKSEFGIDTADQEICPTGNMASFSYRNFLRKIGAIQKPSISANRLFEVWNEFRTWRDDEKWTQLTKRIREYGNQKGKAITICGNGLAPGVDFQVAGLPRDLTENGRIDLRQNQLEAWHSIEENGCELAGKKVPVVLFHDWGFGTPPFPFMAMTAEDRMTWMRTRGAEIYAAGAYFGFPIVGPDGCDAGRDGSLPLIIQLAKFYKSHRDLYLNGEWLGWQKVTSNRPLLSVASWWMPDDHSIAIHLINRNMADGKILPQRDLVLTLPITDVPTSTHVFSPDFSTEQPVEAKIENGNLTLRVPSIEAYTVVTLRFAETPNLAGLRDPQLIVPVQQWQRPSRNEFPVSQSGKVQGGSSLVAFLQGHLHPELRNPPTFLVDFPHPTKFGVHIRTVASQGARLSINIDGTPAVVADLVDRGGKNDPASKSYDKTFECLIPAGRHRVLVDNAGADWILIDWFKFGF